MALNIREKLNMNDALSIAAIHATVISIFVAIFSTYGLHLHSQFKQVKQEIIDEALKADRIINWSSSISVGGKEVCAQFADKDWKHFLKKYQEICALKNADIKFDNREELFCILYKLSKTYPFAVTNEIAMKTDGYHRFYFDNFDEVKIWVQQTRDVISILQRTRSRSDEILSEFYNDSEWGKHAQEFVAQIYESFKDIERFASHLNSKVIKATEYTTILPSNSFFMFLFVAVSGLVFFSGVVLPILCANVDKMFLIWVPIGFYIFIFIYLSYKFLKLSF